MWGIRYQIIAPFRGAIRRLSPIDCEDVANQILEKRVTHEIEKS